MEIDEQFSFKWSRPSTIPFPHVWHRFQAKNSTGKSFNIRIEDLTPDRQDEAWKFFLQHYLVDEPIAKTLQIPEDEASIASLEHTCKELLKQNASLIAVLDEPGPNPKLIGIHVKAVISKGEPLPPPPKTINSLVDKYNYITMYSREGVDVCQELDCDIYYDDFGLCVHKDYRGLKVAENLLEASSTYAIEFKIRGKIVAIVNPFLRRVTEKYGFRLHREIAIKDIKDKDGNAILPEDTRSICFGLCQFY
ncbi:hypothetical protein V9T40_002513 [Parthenolecanium corni]|uniref:N-acetyltransferase domain-containing protein n=1 Tax=Parthenolecanium corni TaxID=536013 RepID=A0AAN9TGT8_9HEMI